MNSHNSQHHAEILFTELRQDQEQINALAAHYQHYTRALDSIMQKELDQNAVEMLAAIAQELDPCTQLPQKYSAYNIEEHVYGLTAKLAKITDLRIQYRTARAHAADAIRKSWSTVGPQQKIKLAAWHNQLQLEDLHIQKYHAYITQKRALDAQLEHLITHHINALQSATAVDTLKKQYTQLARTSPAEHEIDPCAKELAQLELIAQKKFTHQMAQTLSRCI